MKIYFKDDPIKQKMLEGLAECLKNLLHLSGGIAYTEHKQIIEIIELVTNEKIEEVLK